MVRRDHLHRDHVLERRFSGERLFVLEVVEMPAMDDAAIVIIRDMSVHGVERHQRKAECHEGNDHEREATHAASLSLRARAVPAACNRWNPTPQFTLRCRIDEHCVVLNLLAHRLARAGDSTANLAPALAFTVVFLNDTCLVLIRHYGLEQHLAAEIILQGTYIVPAGLCIRAAQLFPRRLTSAQARNRLLAVLLRPAVL